MKAVVKVSWHGKVPELKLATEEGFEHITLSEGRELDLEVVDKRRCTGFHSKPGNHAPCPEFREISSGDQCGECRGKDIYTDYRRGNSGKGLDAEYSVYLAQCGTKAKVGVTKGSRLTTRWREQGANYAAEIFSGLSADEALAKEKEISSNGVSERIRKESKTGGSKEKLSKLMEKLDLKGEVQEVSKPLKCSKVVRKGRFPSPIRNVQGQIVSNGSICLALSSGKCVIPAEQKGLDQFN
ncbi:DUF2797 domain-containing protein [Candidatus Nanohalococcus occultus]|uniref:GIY-YIG superfamily nuclease with N-terminal metal-binding region, DUF2797 family n=1 Tax=Candidatus Nanohalococcus occultus TaxID=2978047 RepID=A0ABY8CDM5_9ARCH|nr:Putative GIY-YIG superfamily nuclease with N-terminal metal-binding region, DUF2797 family [Candidatus Nanohaloarchaeota archaeon SVXNc]